MWTVKRIQPLETIIIFDNSGKQIAEVYDEQHAKLFAATPDLLKLAERVARLNPDAGVIGSGMLASLVNDATAAIRKTV